MFFQKNSYIKYKKYKMFVFIDNLNLYNNKMNIAHKYEILSQHELGIKDVIHNYKIKTYIYIYI